MNMRGFVIALAALAVPTATTTAQSAGKPNVLFIAIDDLNDWTGSLKALNKALVT